VLGSRRPMNDAPGSFRDGRYRVVRVLGEGSQATTFEAVDQRGGKLVAVKRFRVRGARSWKEVELAEREARVLAALSHPSLPHYVEHFEEGGELFLVTEKIEGESLAELQRRGTSFGERDVVRLLRDASAALDYLHGRAPPIIHRDLKPGNVIRRPDGSFAFIDFGAVRDKMKPEGGSTVVGTFGYMAPEQFQGRALPASDVYAVGVTALALLTGREPEHLPHRGLAIDVPAALAGSRVSPALAGALSAMVEPDPDRRAQAIAPVLVGLRDHDAGYAPRPVEAMAREGMARSPAPEPAPKGSFRRLLWLALGLLVLSKLVVHAPWLLVGAMLASLVVVIFGAREVGRFIAQARRALRGDPPPRSARFDVQGEPRRRVAPGGAPAEDAAEDDETREARRRTRE
jgi:serine/threonine protein kinase